MGELRATSLSIYYSQEEPFQGSTGYEYRQSKRHSQLRQAIVLDRTPENLRLLAREIGMPIRVYE